MVRFGWLRRRGAPWREARALRLLIEMRDRRQAILALADSHGARQIRVCGSVARGQEGPRSDIDLLVRFDPGRTLLDLVGLSQDLEDLLGRPVDVADDRALHPELASRLLKEAVSL